MYYVITVVIFLLDLGRQKKMRVFQASLVHATKASPIEILPDRLIGVQDGKVCISSAWPDSDQTYVPYDIVNKVTCAINSTKVCVVYRHVSWVTDLFPGSFNISWVIDLFPGSLTYFLGQGPVSWVIDLFPGSLTFFLGYWPISRVIDLPGALTYFLGY